MKPILCSVAHWCFVVIPKMYFVYVTVDSSATETEDETKHNGLLQQKKVKKKKKKKSRKENKDGVPGMGGRAQWGGNRKHSPPSSHHAQQVKFGRKVQPQHNGGVIQNKPKKVRHNWCLHVVF